jgi:uncharacterized membrane protein
MTPVILAYLFYFIAASASPLQRRWLAVNREGGGQIDFAFRVMLIVALLGSISIPFFKPLVLSGDNLELTGLALVAGIFGAGYFIASYVAQKHVDAGVSSIVSNIYTPITIVLATVFLDESLRPLQIVGTALLLLAIIIISKKHRIGRFRFDKYFLMMLASGAMLGVSLVAERALQKITGFSAGTLFSWWAQCIALGIAAWYFKNKSSYNAKDTTITGLLRFLQALSWVLLIYTVANLSIVSSVTTFKVVVIFGAAAIFLKEREDLPRKIIGSLIAVAGLLLMK